MITKRSALVGALMLAVVRSFWPADAAANAYNVVIVSVDRIDEDFSSGQLQGAFSGLTTTSNLPLLNATSASYTQVDQNTLGGTWSLSDGGANAVSGSFQMPNRVYSSGFGPNSGTITLDPNTSTGVYAGAIGGGSFESFVRFGFIQGVGQITQQVSITRLQFTADGPAQTDHRKVLVAARVGFNNDNTQHGMNVGVPTSDSGPLIVTSVRAEYDYTTFPVQGQGFARNDSGDSQHWSYEVTSSEDLGGFLFRYTGPSTFLEGTGVYAGYVGSAEWESFQVGLGPIAPNVFADNVISIDRYTLGIAAAVPEPQTHVLMLAGLGLVGVFALRRARPTRSRSRKERDLVLKQGALIGALMLAVGDAAANSYEVVVVSVQRASEIFFNGELQGTFSGGVTTSNLPLLSQTTGSYTQVTPGAIGGGWKFTDGGANAIGGSFQMQNPAFTPGLAQTSGSITLDNSQSAGAYSNVSGGGTLEAYTRYGYDPAANESFVQYITIARLQFTADGPTQTDTRPVSVSARIAVNNDNTRHGVNIGVPTSDSRPIVVTTARSEYDYSTPPTHGESFLRNDSGDSQHWGFEVDPASGEDLGSFLFHYYGTATFLDGTGVYADDIATSEWESFEVGTGPIAPNVWGVSLVTIDRYTVGAVPEPQTYVLMLAGLGLVGAIAMRRRNHV